MSLEQKRLRQARICRTVVSDWNRQFLTHLSQGVIEANHIQAVDSVVTTLEHSDRRYRNILGCTSMPLLLIGKQSWRNLIMPNPLKPIPSRPTVLTQLLIELARTLQAIIPRDSTLAQIYTGLAFEDLERIELCRYEQIADWAAGVDDIRLCNSRNSTWWYNMLMYCDDDVVGDPTILLHLYNDTVQCAPYTHLA